MEKLEQMMQVYHGIYLGCLAVMLLFLVIAVILFLRWRIWEAVGILTGRTAEKAISTGRVREADRKENRKNSQKKKSGKVSQGGATERLWYREASREQEPAARQNTVLLETENQAQEARQTGRGTVLLANSDNNGQNFGRTEYLDNAANATAVPGRNGMDTVLLSGSSEGNFGRTEYLDEMHGSSPGDWEMQILDEIVEVHSQERM